MINSTAVDEKRTYEVRVTLLTDKTDVFREATRSKLGLITARGTIKQEDQRQVCPPAIYLLPTQI